MIGKQQLKQISCTNSNNENDSNNNNNNNSNKQATYIKREVEKKNFKKGFKSSIGLK